MQLTYRKPHLSISRQGSFELPSLAVLTGVNGAGKTHFLRAIECGAIVVHGISDPKKEIRFFDWSNLVPNNTGEFHTTALYGDRDAILHWVESAIQQNRMPLLEWAATHDIPHHNGLQGFLRLSENELGEIVGAERARGAWSSLSSIRQSIEQIIEQNARGNTALSSKMAELKTKVGSFGAIRYHEFKESPFGWGQIDIFQQSFSQLFLCYFERRRLNRLRRIDEQEGRNVGVPVLSDEEFIKQEGEPPWDFVNRALNEASLDFQISYPEDWSTTKFTAQLKKVSTGVDLQFSELSSGEKILMSFAFCLYHSQDVRQQVTRPKLLLFDEIDAPLHPAMSRRLIQTIQSSLIQHHHCDVIMTTHSPSTVAVAPEDSIFVMRDGRSDIRKSGKRQAIAVLTSEIPTLSISYDGRRQVFVESTFDADRYSKIYKILTPTLSSERSLEFIGVGRNDRHGAENTGCAQVRKIVNDLTAAGNTSVFGLVDWDAKSESNSRVYVLGHGSRYAIENYLLDPLLIGILLVRINFGAAVALGWNEKIRFPQVCSLDTEALQAFVDRIQKAILEVNAIDDGEKVTYVNNSCLTISNGYLKKQGHELEAMVKNKIPEFRRYTKPGQLLSEVIECVLQDFPGFMPKDLESSMLTLLSAD